MTRILALDLGLKTGVALFDGTTMQSELWRLDDYGDEPHHRFSTLHDRLLARVQLTGPDLIAWEDLHFAGGGPDALISYGGLRAMVLLVASRTGTKYLGVNPATWKREAGLDHGTDAKAALRAAMVRWPGVEWESADVAVSRWIAVAAARKVNDENAD